MAEDLEDLSNLSIAAKDRGQLVEAGEPVQVGGELIDVRRQIETLLEALVAQFTLTEMGLDPRRDDVVLDTEALQDRDRYALRFVEQREEQVVGFHR